MKWFGMPAAALGVAVTIAAGCTRIEGQPVEDFATATATMTNKIDQSLTRLAELEAENAIERTAPQFVVPATAARDSRQRPLFPMPEPLDPVTLAVRDAFGNTLDLLTAYAEQLTFLTGARAIPPTQAAIQGAASQTQSSVQALVGLPRLGVTQAQADGVTRAVTTIANFIIESRVQGGIADAVRANRDAIRNFGAFSRAVIVGNQTVGLAARVNDLLGETRRGRSLLLGNIGSDARVPADRRYEVYRAFAERHNRDDAVKRLPAQMDRTIQKMVEAHDALVTLATAGPSIRAFLVEIERLSALYNQAATKGS